jgi:hypothetical protein
MATMEDLVAALEARRDLQADLDHWRSRLGAATQAARAAQDEAKVSDDELEKVAGAAAIGEASTKALDAAEKRQASAERVAKTSKAAIRAIQAKLDAAEKAHAVAAERAALYASSFAVERAHAAKDETMRLARELAASHVLWFRYARTAADMDVRRQRFRNIAAGRPDGPVNQAQPVPYDGACYWSHGDAQSGDGIFGAFAKAGLTSTLGPRTSFLPMGETELLGIEAPATETVPFKSPVPEAYQLPEHDDIDDEIDAVCAPGFGDEDDNGGAAA